MRGVLVFLSMLSYGCCSIRSIISLMAIPDGGSYLRKDWTDTSEHSLAGFKAVLKDTYESLDGHKSGLKAKYPSMDVTGTIMALRLGLSVVENFDESELHYADAGATKQLIQAGKRVAPSPMSGPGLYEVNYSANECVKLLREARVGLGASCKGGSGGRDLQHEIDVMLPSELLYLLEKSGTDPKLKPAIEAGIDWMIQYVDFLFQDGNLSAPSISGPRKDHRLFAAHLYAAKEMLMEMLPHLRTFRDYMREQYQMEYGIQPVDWASLDCPRSVRTAAFIVYRCDMVRSKFAVRAKDLSNELYSFFYSKTFEEVDAEVVDAVGKEWVLAKRIGDLLKPSTPDFTWENYLCAK